MAKHRTHKAGGSGQRDPGVAKESGIEISPIRWLLPISVVALTVLFFWPTLQNGFVDWDDDKIILENPFYRGLDWAQLRWMFTTFHMGHYQPLSWMSLGLDYLFWGLDSFGYHLTSLLLHSANALIFYFITLRLLFLALPNDLRTKELGIRAAAAFGALIFAVHPLRVESVSWITERRDVLSGLFFFLTILCYLKGAVGPRTNAARWWMASAIIVYGLSLLSKASGMTLPVVLVVLDVYPLRRLSGGVREWFGPEARKVWWEKIPFLLLAIVFAVAALFAQRAVGAMLSLEKYGVGRRLGQALFGIAFYLWKTIVPVNLSPIYAIPFHLESSDRLFFLVSAVVDLALMTVLIIGRNRWPALLAGWVCYLALLAPVLGFTQSGPQIAADRYSYLACLGWAILIGAAPLYFWRIWSGGAGGRQTVLFPAALAAVVVLSLGALTWKQSQVWHDPETLWRYAVSAFPQASKAHNNLANALVHRGRILEAIEHYRQAIRIDRDYSEARHNLGITLAERGELAEAIEQYRAALRINPGYKEAHNDLGIALTYQDKLAEAVQEYSATLQIDPEYKEAHNNLGVALVHQGKLAEGIEHYRQALRIDPAYKEARYNLGIALLDRGETAEAIEQYRQALRIDPNYEEAKYNLNALLQAQSKK